MSRSFLMLLCAGGLNWGSVALAQETPIDFATQIQSIFTEHCAFVGCHAGSNPQQGMSLEAGKAYDNIVNIPSREAPSVMRVKPGDAENSYLHHKLEGEQEELGGSGARMPLGGPYLSEEQIELIGAWINQGALREPPPKPTAVTGMSWGLLKRLFIR